MVLERQIAVLLDSPLTQVDGHLRQLTDAGYIARWSVFEGVRCARILTPGLRLLESSVRPAQKYHLGGYRHDIGVAWLWVLAQRGAFGPLAEVIGERRLRSEAMRFPDRPYAIRLGGYLATGREICHYPDVLLIDPRGRHVALELELSIKELPRREAILAGYGADRRLEGVVYFVERNRTGSGIGRRIQSSAAAMGASDRVHVRTVPPIGLDGNEEPEPRRASRVPERAAGSEVAR